MRTVDQLAVPKETDLAEFPDSTVINQSDAGDGTPVVREIYGDVLTNIYAIVRDAGLIPNGTEDNTSNGHQFLQALKQFANELNDIERIVNISGDVMTVDMDFSPVPDKYVFFARADDNANEAENEYVMQGSGGAVPEFSFAGQSFNFRTGDTLLIILTDQITPKIITISEEPISVNLELGVPINYNDTSMMSYLRNGAFFTGIFSSTNLENTLRGFSGDALAELRQVFIMRSVTLGETFVVCFVFLPGVTTYAFYSLNIDDLATPTLFTIIGTSFPVGSDNNPIVYASESSLYVTNDTGNSANDNELALSIINFDTTTLTRVLLHTLNVSYVKTTNGGFSPLSSGLITLDSSIINTFPLNGDPAVIEQDLQGAGGNLFIYRGLLYYSPNNGQVARRVTAL